MNKTVLVLVAVVTAPLLLIAPLAVAMAGAHGADSACKRPGGQQR